MYLKFGLALTTCLFSLSVMAAPAPAVLEFVVNGQPSGASVVLLTDEGKWLVSDDLLQQFGLATAARPVYEAKGKNYYFLQNLPGVKVLIDEKNLIASLEALPELFSSQKISLATSSTLKLTEPKGVSAYLNYEITGYSQKEQKPSISLNGAVRESTWTVSAEAFKQPGEFGYSSLRARVAKDFPEQMLRVEAGDLTQGMTINGQPGPVQGVSLFKNYDAAPTFQRSPSVGFSGTVDRPAIADVYVDGALVRSVPLKPGPYELDSLRYSSGLRATEVVVRDNAGNELSRTAKNAYFAVSGLAPGLNDYAISVGTLTDGLQKGKLAYLSRYSQGVTNEITLGSFVEGSGDRHYQGVNGIFTLGNFGSISAQLSNASGKVSGQAAIFDYSQQFKKVALNLNYSTFGNKFSAPNPYAIAPLSQSFGGSLAYSIKDAGTFTLSANRQSFSGASPGTHFSLGHQYQYKDVTIQSRVSYGISRGLAQTEVGIYLAWKFGDSSHARVFASKSKDGPSAGTDVSHLAMPGEQMSYRVGAQKSAFGATQSTGFVQYEGDLARVSGNVSAFSGGAVGSATISSALVYVAGELRPSKPIFDSFALVDTGLAGVKVSVNNRLVGTTGSDGKVLVSTLLGNSENQVSIDEQDIPLNYMIPKLRQNVVPGKKTGVVVQFPLRYVQAATGSLARRDKTGGLTPITTPVRLKAEGQEDRVLTPEKNGGFYNEDLPGGTWVGEIAGEDGLCRINLSVPLAKSPAVDLKEVHCVAQ